MDLCNALCRNLKIRTWHTCFILLDSIACGMMCLTAVAGTSLQSLAGRDSGVGLAAPQVGINVRLMVFNPAGERGQGEELVLANPRIISSSRKLELGEEGCLSFLKRNSSELILADVEVHAAAVKRCWRLVCCQPSCQRLDIASLSESTLANTVLPCRAAEACQHQGRGAARERRADTARVHRLDGQDIPARV